MIRSLILLLGLLAAPAAAQEVRGDAAILPGSQVQAILDQCSRSTPPMGQSSWRPTWRDIEALEAALPGALAADPLGRGLVDRQPPTGWVRQYVGVVRDGRRFIYGNFTPARGGPSSEDPSRIAIVCDGGPACGPAG
jgi:hypothetical protein